MPDPLPRFAVHKSAQVGKLRVVRMHGKDHFICLDARDNTRIFHRDALTFTNK
jgi:hypothetical protein